MFSNTSLFLPLSNQFVGDDDAKCLRVKTLKKLKTVECSAYEGRGMWPVGALFSSLLLCLEKCAHPRGCGRKFTNILFVSMLGISVTLFKTLKEAAKKTPHEPDIKVKGRFMGPFNTAAIDLLYSYPNKFPHSSPEAPRTIQMRGTSTSEGGNYYLCILLANL